MKRRMTKLFVGLCLLAMTFLNNRPVFAEENTEALKRQIESLQKRIEVLEAAQSPEKREDAWSGYNQRQNRRFDPFAEMNRMQKEMDRIFQDSFSRDAGQSLGGLNSQFDYDYNWDMKETKDGYEIVFEIAGLDKDKLDIQINEHSITVKGERSQQDQTESPQGFFHAQSYGTYMKTIPLPIDADTSKVKTEKEGEHLVIKIPKKTS